MISCKGQRVGRKISRSYKDRTQERRSRINDEDFKGRWSRSANVIRLPFLIILTWMGVSLASAAGLVSLLSVYALVFQYMHIFLNMHIHDILLVIV